jgi:hypothetical protein
LIAIVRLQRGYYGPTHKIPDSPNGAPRTAVSKCSRRQPTRRFHTTKIPRRPVATLARNVKEGLKAELIEATTRSQPKKKTFEANFYWRARFVRKSFGATAIFRAGRDVEASNLGYRLRVGATKTSDNAHAMGVSGASGFQSQASEFRTFAFLAGGLF